MDILFSPELKTKNIELSVIAWEINDLTLHTSNYDFSPRIQEIEQIIRQKYTIENIKDDPIIAAYRSFYWKYLNIDPTKTRPACEALIRRILADKPIPKISPFVDAYNWGSIESGISLGAYDLDSFTGPITIRIARPNEKFIPIGSETKNLPVTAIVVADANEIILCQYPYRDGQKTMVTPNSKNVIVLAYGANGITQNQVQEGISMTNTNINWLINHNMIQLRSTQSKFFQN